MTTIDNFTFVNDSAALVVIANAASETAETDYTILTFHFDNVSARTGVYESTRAVVRIGDAEIELDVDPHELAESIPGFDDALWEAWERYAGLMGPA